MSNITELNQQNSVVQNVELKIIGKKEATKKKLKRYFTGVKCRSGHLSERMCCSGRCLECHRVASASHRNKHPEKYRLACVKYYNTTNGKNKNNESSLRWRLNPKNKELIAQSKYNCKAKNRNLYNAISKTYSKRVKNSRPKWQNAKQIKEYYLEACKVGLEVDHIIPINSPIVCGLHCLDNFQMLTRTENATKGNRLWPDMP
jgi:hypothetical protein